MMLIGCPKETAADEKRVALTPESALQIQKLGYQCVIEAGAGDAAGFTDTAYEKAGVTIAKTATNLWKSADIIIKVLPPISAETKRLAKGQTLISFFYPAQNTQDMEIIGQKWGQYYCHGYGTADKPRPENGRAQFNG